MTDELTARQRDILTFEARAWWQFDGTKEQAIRDRFNTSPIRYYSQLNALIDTAAALAAEPALVRRLQRLRHARARGAGRRIGDADLRSPGGDLSRRDAG